MPTLLTSTAFAARLSALLSFFSVFLAVFTSPCPGTFPFAFFLLSLPLPIPFLMSYESITADAARLLWYISPLGSESPCSKAVPRQIREPNLPMQQRCLLTDNYRVFKYHLGALLVVLQPMPLI